MMKHTKNSLKFNKLLEFIFKLKVKLLNSSYEKDIAEIDQRAKALFEVYNNNNNYERKHDG